MKIRTFGLLMISLVCLLLFLVGSILQALYLECNPSIPTGSLYHPYNSFYGALVLGLSTWCIYDPAHELYLLSLDRMKPTFSVTELRSWPTGSFVASVVPCS
jgi:hypothetical protein